MILNVNVIIGVDVAIAVGVGVIVGWIETINAHHLFFNSVQSKLQLCSVVLSTIKLCIISFRVSRNIIILPLPL